MAGFNLNGRHRHDDEPFPRDDNWPDQHPALLEPPTRKRIQQPPPATPASSMPQPPIEQTRLTHEIGAGVIFIAGVMVGLFGALAFMQQRRSSGDGKGPLT